MWGASDTWESGSTRLSVLIPAAAWQPCDLCASLGFCAFPGCDGIVDALVKLPHVDVNLWVTFHVVRVT